MTPSNKAVNLSFGRLGIISCVLLVMLGVNLLAFRTPPDKEIAVSTTGVVSWDAAANKAIGKSVVHFINKSRKKVLIAGFDSPCSCLSVKGLPLHIEPGKEATATIEAASAAVLQRRDTEMMVRFMTDQSHVRWLTIRVVVDRGCE